MNFTAMVRPVLLNTLGFADARLIGISEKGSPYTIGATGTTTQKLYLDANWSNPPFDLGGGNMILMNPGEFYETGGLILSGNSLPYPKVLDGSDDPVLVGGNYKYYYAEFSGETTTLTSYHEYTSYRSVITDTKYNLDGADGTDGTDVGTPDFDPGTVDTTTYFIHLAVPLLVVPGTIRFVVFKEFDSLTPGIADDAIDLRRYISQMTWSTAIDKGYDTATIELNESASNLGQYYSYLLGQNIEIIDIYGNRCWNGLVTNIYVDGGGGRIDATGYKKTFEWFRFDKLYIAPEGGFDVDERGPTSSQVLHDATLFNPYMKHIFLDQNDPSGTSINWGTKGFVDGNGYTGMSYDADKSWPRAQHIETSYVGLNELDFSDGSFKCSDAIEAVESFGYAYTNETDFDADTMHFQCWADGYVRVIRVKKDPSTLTADYVISRKNVRSNYRGVEISGDINDIVTEVYVIYTDENGENLVSSSIYNSDLLTEYGARVRVQTTDFGPELSFLVAQAARADKNSLIGLGNVDIQGNVKAGGGSMNNLPCYLMKAGMVAEFEDNIGHGSLYRNRSGTPGIFYIGSTSFNTSTNTMSVSPALTQSAVELFLRRQSSLTNQE